VSESVEYRDIPEFPGYRVGSDGSVWSCWRWKGGGVGSKRQRVTFMSDRWRLLKQRSRDGVSGYPSVDLWRDGKPHTRTTHILVLTAFVGPPPAGMECLHGDGNRANNRLTNLRWGTHLENVRDQVQQGTIQHGSRHYNAKLTESIVRDIRAEHATGGIGYRRLAKKYSITMGTVQGVVLRRTWKHVL
jgi:hypothetical protein